MILLFVKILIRTIFLLFRTECTIVHSDPVLVMVMVMETVEVYPVKHRA